MECPICFVAFDLVQREPLRTFCCGQAVCKICIRSILDSTRFCPWDRRRWTGRNVLQRFHDATPPSYIEEIQKRAAACEETEINPNHRSCSALGSGELRREFELFQRRGDEKDSERSALDRELANMLLEDELGRLFRLKQLQDEDEKLARMLASDSGQKRKAGDDCASSNSYGSSSSGGSGITPFFQRMPPNSRASPHKSMRMDSNPLSKLKAGMYLSTSRAGLPLEAWFVRKPIVGMNNKELDIRDKISCWNESPTEIQCLDDWASMQPRVSNANYPSDNTASNHINHGSSSSSSSSGSGSGNSGGSCSEISSSASAANMEEVRNYVGGFAPCNRIGSRFDVECTTAGTVGKPRVENTTFAGAMRGDDMFRSSSSSYAVGGEASAGQEIRTPIGDSSMKSITTTTSDPSAKNIPSVRRIVTAGTPMTSAQKVDKTKSAVAANTLNRYFGRAPVTQ